MTHPLRVRAAEQSLEPHMRNGSMWVSGSGKVSIGANNRLHVLITNPAGSTKVLRVYESRLVATAAVWCHYTVNPTTNLPTTNRIVHSARIDGRVHDGVISVKSDVSATPMSGGLPSDVVLGVGGAGIAVQPLPIFIYPGFSLGFDTISANNVDAAFALAWLELPQ